MTASKAKGTAWETALVNELRSRGERVYRHSLSGKDDEGDLSVEDLDLGLHIVIEAKDRAAFTPAQYMTEALRERDNYAKKRGLDPADCIPIAIVKARGKNVKQAYVLTTLEEYFRDSVIVPDLPRLAMHLREAISDMLHFQKRFGDGAAFPIITRGAETLLELHDGTADGAYREFSIKLTETTLETT